MPCATLEKESTGTTPLAAETARYLGASAHYADASSRDPRTHSFGYVAADPSTGARGPFLWFSSPSELLDFLCTVEVMLLQFDDAVSSRISASLRRSLAGVRNLSRVELPRLTAAFEGWNEILWMGSLNDLCERGGEIPSGARIAFRRAQGHDAHALPISDEEMDGFVAWVTAYAEPSSGA